MFDTRKVQTAVLGSAGSQQPVFLPFDHAAALRLRGRYQHKTFHCGIWLGGCGRRLHTRIGRERVPHFAHDPERDGSPVVCGRAESDERSADHLYIRRDLPRWLRAQGLTPGATTLEGSIPGEGGVCTGVLTRAGDGALIAVALRDDPSHGGFADWPARDEALRATHPNVTWLFGEHTSLAHHLIDRQGYVYRIRCRTHDDTRNIEIGTQIGSAAPRWVALSACEYTSEGLRTPHTGQALALRPLRSVRAQVPSPDTRPSEASQPTPAPEEGNAFQELKGIVRQLNELSSSTGDLERAAVLFEQGWAAYARLRPGPGREWVRESLEIHEDRLTRGKLTESELKRIRQEIEEEKRRERERLEAKRAAAQARHEYEQLLEDTDMRRTSYEQWFLQVQDVQTRLADRDRRRAGEMLARASAHEFHRVVGLLRNKDVYDKEAETLIVWAHNAQKTLEERYRDRSLLDTEVRRLTQPPPKPRERKAPQPAVLGGGAIGWSKLMKLNADLDEARPRADGEPADPFSAIALIMQAWDLVPALEGEEQAEALRAIVSHEDWIAELTLTEWEAADAQALKLIEEAEAALGRKPFSRAVGLLIQALRTLSLLPFGPRRHLRAQQTAELESKLRGYAPPVSSAWDDQLRVLRLLDAAGWLKRVEEVPDAERSTLREQASAAVERLPEDRKEPWRARLQHLYE